MDSPWLIMFLISHWSLGCVLNQTTWNNTPHGIRPVIYLWYDDLAWEIFLDRSLMYVKSLYFFILLYPQRIFWPWFDCGVFMTCGEFLMHNESLRLHLVKAWLEVLFVLIMLWVVDETFAIDIVVVDGLLSMFVGNVTGACYG